MRENVSKFKLKQINRGFKDGEMLSPEVLRAIETMMEKKQYKQEGSGERHQLAAKGKIALDDSEFGKY